MRKISSALVLGVLTAILVRTEGRNVRLGHSRSINNAVDVVFDANGEDALKGFLGMGLPDAVGQVVDDCLPGDPGEECMRWGDFAELFITSGDEGNDYCATVDWRTRFARRLEDCFDIEDGTHWYGGPGPTRYHRWPIESVSRNEAPVVSMDVLGGYEYGGVTENYWLLSSGVAIHVDEDIPLHITMNTTQSGKICLIAEAKHPYKPRDELRLKYQVCTAHDGQTFKDVHQNTFRKFYGKPIDTPDEGMLLKPFWSTWAEYKSQVNQTLVLDLARRLIAEGFVDNSHIEIDDMWETCYGEMEFDLVKFPDPKGMVEELTSMNFNTTLWVQPMININCPAFMLGYGQQFFVTDEKYRSGLTYTWLGQKTAAHIDFTNPDAVKWWSDRVEKLRTDYGITSFKFDAGETSWLPYSFLLNGDVNNTPNLATTMYVEAVTKFGRMIEIRVGRQTQHQPVFVRMLDKDSTFGYNNGLQSIIPALFDFGLKGYPFVLPDMIGGNSYGTPPSKELYIRWIQANSFMPAVQFSVLPWNFDQETVDAVKTVLALRNQYKDNILSSAAQAVQDGTWMNRPMWWVDPTDVNTFTIDDQYMLGDDILVAPVLVEGATSRDIYLPQGTWMTDVHGSPMTYEGPMTIKDFEAPLLTLPFFIRQ